MDIDKIVDELSKIKLYDEKQFRIKLALLKKKDPSAFIKVVKILGIDVKEASRLGKGTSGVYDVFKKDKKNKNGNSIMLAVVAMLAVGFVLIGVVFVFLILIPTSGDVSLNATESIIIGHNLFSSISNTTYLQYSFEFNESITTNSVTTKNYNAGREYYVFTDGDFTLGTFTNNYFCQEGSCSLTETNNIISNKKNDLLNFNINECVSYSTINIDSFLPYTCLSIYDELFYFVTNGFVVDSIREEAWQIGGVACAPILIEVNPPTNFLSDELVLNELSYQLCIDNDGVPIAMAKHLSYNNGNVLNEKIFIAFLESTNPIIGSTQLGDNNLDGWVDEGFSC